MALWKLHISHEVNYSEQPRLCKLNDSSVMNLRIGQYRWCIIAN